MWGQSMRKSMTSSKTQYLVYYFFLLTPVVEIQILKLVVEIQILKLALWKQQDVMKKKNVTPKVPKVCQEKDIGITHIIWPGFFKKI